MIAQTDIPFRLITAAELLAMSVVRACYSAPRGKQPAQASSSRSAEPARLMGTLAVLTLLHFGAISRVSGESFAVGVERV